ncbi:hypothetical protein [Croceicoccus mobilis]|uniref:Uncharacterized protein n=1 Tax=Croceicoccus mobilis TaxID=1703339 RepID=A0A917DXW8_9SPHN|nr:hypothetical protein [Croceicoccus mobilis]GGD81986.1 hypothetical protein GCM10010990_34930 [Croceicoccus mobilis]
MRKPTINDTALTTQGSLHATYSYGDVLIDEDCVPDRSISAYELYENDDLQSSTDTVILKAMLVPPVADDHILLGRRPTIEQLCVAILHQDFATLTPYMSDDCAVISADESVVALITISDDTRHDETRYLLSIHLLTTSAHATDILVTLKSIAELYDPIAYPDSALIDETGLSQTGKGFREYQRSERRRRPLFIMRRKSPTMTAVQKHDYTVARQRLGAYGPVIVNNDLYEQFQIYEDLGRMDAIIIHPKTCAVGSLYYTGASGQLEGLSEEAADAPLLGSDWLDEQVSALQANARTFLSSSATRPPRNFLKLMEAGATRLADQWKDITSRDIPHEPAHEQETAPDSPPGRPLDPDTPPEADHELITPTSKPGSLDLSQIPDVITWLETNFDDKIIILPKAKRAFRKSAHPDPQRIAEAIALLATTKYTQKQPGEYCTAFTEGLSSLHLHDGFSNAERLKGQTGEAYLARYGTRTILLDRKLASYSSAFNSPQMIRIYYTYDKPTRKIIIGWLPSHLPTTRS